MDAVNRRWVLRGTGAAVLAALGLRLLWPKRHLAAAEVRRRADALGARHQLRIDYGPPETFFVPPYPPESARLIGGQATAVDFRALPVAFDGLEQALAQYPPGFVASVCKAIFLCGSLSLDGAEAGGTYGPAWLILVVNQSHGEAGMFETARLGVHHELSSLIWNHFPDVQQRWATLMPPGWTPVRDNAEALSAAERRQQVAAEGFLSAYGATTMENDFNVFAETAMTDASRLVNMARASRVVASKTGLLIEAYQRLDPRLESIWAARGLASFLASAPSSATTAKVAPVELPTGEIVHPPGSP